MRRVQTLNGVHVSSHRPSAGGFECSGPLSLSQTDENAENMRQVGCEERICLMMFATF